MLQDPALRFPVAISLGAIAGALSRYYLNLWFLKTFGSEFPYGIFVINISGCLVMGLFTTLVLEQRLQLAPELQLLVTTGFLGSYTTFSTYGLDVVLLWQRRPLLALGYWLGSAIFGIAAVSLGSTIARIWRF